ncbi:MAG: cation:proton antiporter [Spirochaetales bacterium]|nr:cation:proton antiporter [Spirochaetales bacterium]
MVEAHDFLKALAVVLGVAAVTTVIFQRLRQPVVLGYIIAGLIVGPYVPIPLAADSHIVHTLSEFGVILFMFSLGLEFSIRRFIKVAPVAGLAAVVECSIMIWLGFVAGRMFGWSEHISIYAGAIVAISSTAIAIKAFEELEITGPIRELVVGILIVEDLIAILIMALLGSIPASGEFAPDELGGTGFRLAAFLIGMVAFGLLLVPRAIRAVHKLGRQETTLVASVGVCFVFALLADSLGYSAALGAFIAGSLVAESGHDLEIEELVTPIRDMFAAVFFVSVGMLIDPAAMLNHWLPILVFTLIVIFGKSFGVSLGGFLGGNGIRTSVRAAMSLTQIGEFSFIIAGLGLARGAVPDSLYAIAVAVSAVTALSTPWMIRASEPAAHFIDRKLPPALQTFAALYGSWIEKLRTSPSGVVPDHHALRRSITLLIVDATAIVALIIVSSLSVETVSRFVAGRLEIERDWPAWALVGAAGILCLPFGLGIVRVSRRLGLQLAEAALPRVAATRFDPADAPRRAFVVGLQLAILLLVGGPMVAITQPFLPWGAPGALVLVIVVVALGLGLWRSSRNLQGHVRAGAEMVLEVLGAQARSPSRSAHAIPEVEKLLPGLGQPTAFRLPANSPCIGQTLAELNLRGRTGATVLALTREEGGVVIPGPDQMLNSGDVLALAGTSSAIEQAVLLLKGKSAEP